MKIIVSLLLLGVTILHAGYITPPLQAVLDTLSPGNKTWVSVHLTEKPNLARFPQKAYAEKITHLKGFSQRTQRPLIDFANSFGNQVDSLKSFWVYNGFTLKTTKPVIVAIASMPEVEFVNGGAGGLAEEPSGSVPPPPRQIEWNIERVRADEVWSMAYTGEGIVICIFDSGMREDHQSYGDWLTKREVLASLQCSEKDYRNLIRKGRLKVIRAYRIGTRRPRILVSKQSLNEYLVAQSEKRYNINTAEVSK